MKEDFKKEIEKIKDEKLRKAALDIIPEIPSYFWTEAASSSGKYHPKISLGEGGLARHSLMVCKIAQDFIESEIFLPKSDDVYDWAIIASLFHDSMKRGKYSKHTVFEHPLLAAKFVQLILNENGVDHSVINIICNAIASHMGKWNTASYSKVVLPTPNTNFERLIHAADYMASRKYIGGLEEWNIK